MFCRRKIPSAFIAMWVLGFLTALFSVSNAERLPIRTYTTTDGLPHNRINRIVRDSRGFLWFCTGEGLSRFDGYAFTNYGVSEGLPHPIVNDLLETKSGDYWIATNAGLCKFNPKGMPTTRPVYVVDLSADVHVEAMFTTYTPDEDDQLSKAVLRVIESRDNSIWCGTRQGLFSLSAGSRMQMVRIESGLPKERPPSYVTSLLEDRFGTLWIGTPSGLYRRWPDGNVARYGKELPDDNIQDLLEDRRGLLWMGTREGGLISLTVTGERERPIVTHAYKRSTTSATNWVFDVCESSDGTLWAGTNYDLVKLQLGEQQQINLTRIDTKGSGFSYREIESVAEDRDGNIWLGTANGAMKIARNGFRTLDQLDGVDMITSVFESATRDLYAYGYVFGDKRASVFEGGNFDVMRPDSLGYWFSMGHFDGQRFTWIAPRSWTNNGWTNMPYIIQSRSGEWWVGQRTGLYLVPRVETFAELKTARPIAIYSTKEGLPSTVVYSIYEDRRGDLWISTLAETGNGLARWDRATRRIVDLTRTEGLPSLKHHLPATFAEDLAGNMWVGFQPEGLGRYAADRFTYFTVDDGLPAGRVNDLHLDDAGRLWVATSRGGVSRIDEPISERPTFVNYTTEQGLSSNVTTVLTDDLYGRIYVGTGRGVDQITAATGQVKHFTTADGLAPGEIVSAIRDRTGMLWFAARKGLSRFLPEREHSSEPPPILINGLLVAGARHNVSAVGEADFLLPDLSASENQLQIDFIGISFVTGESLRYQYRLEGADADWSAPTEQRSITFAKLSPGRYRFLVRAVDSDGVFSLHPATVTFRVLPPIWGRWWFIAVAGALAATAGYAIYRYRVAQLVELERVRTRIAADLHDDIGSSLSQISVLSEVLRNQLKAPEPPVSKNLSLINRVSQEALDSMSDIVWAINPQQDHLSDLLRRMRRVASEALPARDIEFTFNAPATGLELRLGADIRRQVFLMFKETINNLVRHSKCTRSLINLKIEGPLLVLTVADNGNGFDLDHVTEGNGLVSIHRRARSLGGESVVSSKKGEGTTITIKIPHSRQTRASRGNGKH